MTGPRARRRTLRANAAGRRDARTRKRMEKPGRTPVPASEPPGGAPRAPSDPAAGLLPRNAPGHRKIPSDSCEASTRYRAQQANVPGLPLCRRVSRFPTPATWGRQPARIRLSPGGVRVRFSGPRSGRGRDDLVLRVRFDQRRDGVRGRDDPAQDQSDRKSPFTDSLHGFSLPCRSLRAAGVPVAKSRLPAGEAISGSASVRRRSGATRRCRGSAAE